MDKLKYIKTINGTLNKSAKESIISDMVSQYNEANNNVITEFDVLINSDKAETVLVNGTPKKILMEYENNKNSSDSSYCIRIQGYPNDVNTGDYITETIPQTNELRNYIVTSLPQLERNCEINYATHCNQIINISKEIKIPCIVEGESYGVKLDATSEGGFKVDSNTKVKITMPDNHITREIKLGTRIMLRNHKEGIYELSNLDVYNKNLFVFVCKKDNYRDGDDLENGICFNGDLVEPPIADYTIHGEDSIVVNKDYTYNITPTEGVVAFELDSYTITNKIAEIISHTDYTVTIRALIPDEVITLNVLHNGVVSGSKDIVTSRR